MSWVLAHSTQLRERELSYLGKRFGRSLWRDVALRAGPLPIEERVRLGCLASTTDEVLVMPGEYGEHGTVAEPVWAPDLPKQEAGPFPTSTAIRRVERRVGGGRLPSGTELVVMWHYYRRGQTLVPRKGIIFGVDDSPYNEVARDTERGRLGLWGVSKGGHAVSTETALMLSGNESGGSERVLASVHFRLVRPA